MNKAYYLAALCLFTARPLLSCNRTTLPPVVATYDPKNGFIPDDRTAIAVAEAICQPFYGKERVEAERPFKATIENEVWTVRGSLPEGGHVMGGALLVRIAKKDGRILELTHEQ